MKKNYRKIPDFIKNKVQTLNNNIVVAAIFDLTRDDFRNSIFSGLKLDIENERLIYNPNFIPNASQGRYSKKNIEGYTIKHPHLPLVRKEIYLGERPIWGDYNNGTFSLVVYRMVRAYEEIPPKNIAFVIELLETRSVDEQVHYILKISTDQVINSQSQDFETELLFNINLLQENFGKVDVFNSETTLEEYLRTLTVEWEIFPPGVLGEDLKRITNGLRNVTPQRMQEISERFNFLWEQHPTEMITGRSGMLRYFGAKFSDNLVVFENTQYGNALYILFENWAELSQLSRLEILGRPSDQYVRIKHSGNWQSRVKQIIEEKQ